LPILGGVVGEERDHDGWIIRQSGPARPRHTVLLLPGAPLPWLASTTTCMRLVRYADDCLVMVAGTGDAEALWDEARTALRHTCQAGKLLV